MKNTIFFENILPLHYPFVWYFLLRGYEIYVFDFNPGWQYWKKRKWLLNLIDSGKIKKIYIKPATEEHGMAIDHTESIFFNLRETKLPKIAALLYKSDETAQVFKKILVGEIFKCLFINSYLAEAEQNLKKCHDVMYFVPVNYKKHEKLITRYSEYQLKPLSRTGFYKCLMPLLPIIHILDKVKYYFAVTVQMFLKDVLLAVGQLRKQKADNPATYKHVVPIDFGFQVKLSGQRGFDFLLDHNNIDTENTIFILNVPVKKEWLNAYKEKGYRFIISNDIYCNRNLAGARHRRILIKNINKAIINMISCLNAPTPFIQAFATCIKTYINWNLLFEQISFDNYIYTNRESAEQSAINILIRNHGGRSWCYSSFIGGGYLNSNGTDFKSNRHILWSFICSDYFLGVNDDVIRYYKLHHQSIKQYYSIGSIYSEIIREQMKNISREEFVSKHFNQKATKKTKIITFFDTTFVDLPDVMTNYQDCIDFYRDIIKLLNSSEDLLIIIKPSKREVWFTSPEVQSVSDMSMEIIRLWEILKSNPRVFWAVSNTKFKGFYVDFTYNEIVIAVSDLVITHCMSSPTAEALGARKKAIWYESGNKHRGIMYDKIPGLVAHGYKELEERVDYLLYKVSDEEYNEYLDKYIKGKVESHLDGMALTRFRQMVSSSNNRN